MHKLHDYRGFFVHTYSHVMIPKLFSYVNICHFDVLL